MDGALEYSPQPQRINLDMVILLLQLRDETP